MNKGKAVLLVLALVLPVSIFLFLKFFGKNEFAVEPFYTHQLPEHVNAHCSYEYSLPYMIPEYILTDLLWAKDDSLTLFYFGEPAKEILFNKILENYQRPMLKIISVNAADSAAIQGAAHNVQPTLATLELWKECFLFVEEPNDLLLVDNQRRIRGYYQLDNREDMDRLMIELSILLRLY